MQMVRKASAQRAQSQTPQASQGMASPSHLPRPATPKAPAPPPSEGEAAAGKGSAWQAIQCMRALLKFKIELDNNKMSLHNNTFFVVFKVVFLDFLEKLKLPVLFFINSLQQSKNRQPSLFKHLKSI